MDSRTKDWVRNTNDNVVTLLGLVGELTAQVEKLRKDLKSMKRSTVRKYNKKDGQS